MSLETDLLLDRRRLKRRLNLWRVLAVAGLAAAVLVAVLPRGSRVSGAHVARVNVRGIITEDRKLLDAVMALAKDASVRAVIVSIDSPGGSVAGGESLRDALIRVQLAKPVVAVMNGIAASAGYMVALPAERIFAREGTLTGSIGVIMQTTEVSGLMAYVGVGGESIASGPLKDQPSFTHKLSPQGREYLSGLVMEMYDQFISSVAKSRKLDKEKVRALADGRVYTGRQALGIGLVDQLGDEVAARAWLAEAHKVPESLPATDVRVGSPLDRLTGVTGNWDALLSSVLGARRLPAGAWAIWQGAAE